MYSNLQTLARPSAGLELPQPEDTGVHAARGGDPRTRPVAPRIGRVKDADTSAPASAALLLDGQGFILESEGDTQAVFGYADEALIHRHVSLVLPKMRDVALFDNGQLNARLHYLCHLGVQFRITPKGGRAACGYLSLVDLSNMGQPRVRLLVRQAAEGTEKSEASGRFG